MNAQKQTLIVFLFSRLEWLAGWLRQFLVEYVRDFQQCSFLCAHFSQLYIGGCVCIYLSIFVPDLCCCCCRRFCSPLAIAHTQYVNRYVGILKTHTWSIRRSRARANTHATLFRSVHTHSPFSVWFYISFRVFHLFFFFTEFAHRERERVCLLLLYVLGVSFLNIRILCLNSTAVAYSLHTYIYAQTHSHSQSRSQTHIPIDRQNTHTPLLLFRFRSQCSVSLRHKRMRCD